MRTRMVEERIGELLGPVDWSYNFRSHFDNMCCNDAVKAEYMARRIETLWQVERAHLKGTPLSVNVRDYWHDLISVGMYDGWPYWRPTPAVCFRGTLGSEWAFFYDLHGWKERP